MSDQKSEVERTEGQELTGVVKRYNSKNGFGFITADDGGADLFVHQSEIQVEGFRCLEEGAKVKFTFITRDGKPTATKVEGSDKPLKTFKSLLEAMTSTVNVKPGYELGTCKWFNTGKGFGFLRKENDTEEDVDIFAHIKDCAGMIPLREGQKVTFTLETEESGRLRGRNISGVGPPAAPAPHAIPMQPQIYAAPPQPFYGVPQPQNLPTHPPQITPGTHVGTIKFYNASKGFGFIITAMNTELYLGKAGLVDQNWIPQISDVVEYTEETNHEKVWAMNCRKTDPSAGRKRNIAQVIAQPFPIKAPRTDYYQDSAHTQFAPPQPGYQPPMPQYQQQPQYAPPQSNHGAAPGYQYDQYQQQPPQPSAQPGYDYNRPAGY